MGLANDRYLSLKPVVLQHELFLVLSSFLWDEKEDHLGDLTNFQNASIIHFCKNALALANAEVIGTVIFHLVVLCRFLRLI